MANNIFKFLSLKPFPYDESSFKTTLKNEIKKKIDFVKESATEGQKASLCSRAVVSDEEELIEFLEEILDKIENEDFIKKESEQYFNELYGDFIKQFPLLIENGVVYQNELDELLKKLKLDNQLAKELIEYKKDVFPKFNIKPKRDIYIVQKRELIDIKDYQIIKSFLSNSDKPTYNKLCEHFNVKDINSSISLKKLIDEKLSKVDSKLAASSELVLYNTLRKYCNNDKFIIMLESFYIFDIIDLFEQKWEKFIKDGVLSWNELNIIYVDGISKGYLPTQITDTLKYWCETNEKYLYIPPEIEDARDDVYECPFCKERVYKAVSRCSKCDYTLNEALYLVDRINKFSKIEGRYKILVARHKEIINSIKPKLKYASKDVLEFIKQNERYLAKKNVIRRRIRISLCIVMLLLITVTSLLCFLSYIPYVNGEKIETIHIKTKDDFLNILNSSNLNDIYILDNDISFFGDEIKPIGSVDNPFRGCFYGNGYTLSNFVIKNDNSPVALFMYNEGKINRLGIETVTIESNNHAAGFVYQNSGEILDCYAYDMSISSSNLFSTVSGFVTNNNGKINSCYSCISSVNTEYIMAGFVLNNGQQGSISDSFVKVNENIEEKSMGIGSFYAVNKGNINNAYTSILEDVDQFDFIDLEIKRSEMDITNDKFYLNVVGWSSLIWDISNDHIVLRKDDTNE